MKLPVTANGFVRLLQKIEKTDISGLKGFENLSRYKQNLLQDLSVEISNIINEYDTNDYKNTAGAEYDTTQSK